MSRILTGALGVAAAVGLASAAMASPPHNDQQVVVLVRASDAELHTPEGAKALALRVRNAAAEACGRDAFPAVVRISDGFIRCREAAIDRAVRDIGSSMLADALGRPPQILASRNH